LYPALARRGAAHRGAILRFQSWREAVYFARYLTLFAKGRNLTRGFRPGIFVEDSDFNPIVIAEHSAGGGHRPGRLARLPFVERRSVGFARAFKAGAARHGGSKNLFDPERGAGATREAEENSRSYQRVRNMILVGTVIIGNNRTAILQDGN